MLHAQYHLIQSNRYTEGAAMTRAIDMHGHLLNQDYLDLLSAHGALQEDGFPLPTFDEDATIATIVANHMGLLSVYRQWTQEAGQGYSMQIDCSGLRPGIYILYINVNGKVYSEKVTL